MRLPRLVPWRSAYESVNHLGGPLEFVLGGGGHITGPVNPYAKNKRHYWTGGKLGGAADDWLAGAEQHKGSWWPHYARWLGRHSGGQVPAPKTPGNKAFRTIEAAPGRYVTEHVSAG